MYPNLYYAFKDLFGVSIPGLRFVNSFGFFLAIAFLAAAALLARELKRKSKAGLLQPTEEEITVGSPVTVSELVINFLIGFLFGYKIIALFFLSSDATQDPQAFIFSGMGNWPLGISLGLIFAGMKWWDKKKHQLSKPEKRKVRIWPEDRVGEITVLGLIFGVIGAKVFDIFENWSSFLQRPLDYLLSGGGLTFYGGLICATVAITLYARKHKIGVRHLADAIAPPLMIAYAIGRIGCQVSGDGDWGVYNTAFATSATGVLSPALPGAFETTVKQNQDFFSADQAEFGTIPNLHVPKPSSLGFLPDWFFAYNYPNNVNKVGVPLQGCTEQHCTQLPVPTFPTPLYETIACTLLFFILWGLRKRLKPFGAVFALYLILNGLERFLIEKIRVNNELNILGMHPSQAEIISLGLVISGIILWVVLKNKTNDLKAG
ncbi:MAG: prolipoprotein diacylglyceryl transferase family protein [Chitinophagaceae bacterium]